MTTQIPLWIIPFFPLLGALTLGAIALVRIKSEQAAPEAYIGALAVLFPLCSFVATVVFAADMPRNTVYAETLGNWMSIGYTVFPLAGSLDAWGYSPSSHKKRTGCT